MQPLRLLLVSTLMTVVTTVVLGLGYPLAVTGLAQLLFPRQANGLDATGRHVGGDLIGQPFASPGYFRSRPSAAGQGYDAGASGGSNLGPTSATLVERVRTDATKLQATNPGVPVPIDLVTSSGSGLDPHISPAAAAFQAPRVARERGLERAEVERLIAAHTEGRQLGLLGEPRVHVLRLNRALDQLTRP
ncbi:MAG: potassium-transporting ATPase subunit KdpC [Vicinamibacterales bacterium]|jgi:K+-transporting ATPase ATPase C chain|nr:potassium-transporting ATPase subunit KdpC [Vicinamibacterales bacterium]